MSVYIRPRIPGAQVFLTVNLAVRGGDLLVREIALLREAVRVARASRPFKIHAWVVMPDHMHCVWELPKGETDYSTRVAAIKAGFVMRLRRAGFSPPIDLPVVASGRYAGLKPGLRQGKREVGVWQRRFWEHHIRDEAEFCHCVKYCWMNPVKHGFAERPEDWPYSSFQRDVA